MSIEIIGLECNCALDVAHRICVSVECDKRKADIMVEHCVCLIQSDRLSDHVDGDVGVAEFEGDKAQMMEAGGMLGVGDQGLMIEIHRLGQPFCLEMSQGLSEQACGHPLARA